MSPLGIARTVHVLALVWWLGGVAMMTTVIAPVLRRADLSASERRQLLMRIRRRFVLHARIALLLIGASGAGLLWGLGGLDRLTFANGGSQLVLMLVTWSLFALLLFVLEPLSVMARLFANPRVFLRFQALLLSLAMSTAALGVLFAHGGH